jgi:hypothetical protein
MKISIEIEISIELREECVKLFKLCDEFSSPETLRAFVSIKGLELVKECIIHSERLNFDQMITSLLKAGRSFLEPALFDLLDALAFRYDGDVKAQACKELKEKLRKAIPSSEDPEQADYQRLVQGHSTGDGEGITYQAQRWIEAAGDDLDELALRITLAVFNGVSFEWIERAKDDLLELLQQVLPPAIPEASPQLDNKAPPHSSVPVLLMRRLKQAGARETDARPSDSKRVVELYKPDLGSEALNYAWQLYREKKWRQKFIEWLTSYAAGRPVDVRTRVAVAVGRLAITDYRFIRDHILDPWVWAETRQAEYRTAIGMALGVIIREERWAGEVQKLLSDWSQSTEQAKRWAATRAYIYVGAYWQPVREVIARWRNIAASELVAINIQVSGNLYMRVTNPLHMSLMDAMMRFFMNIAQLPDEEKRPIFEGILEGLQNWIADDTDDAYLGLFTFTMLGKLVLASADQPDEGLPVLFQLVEEQSDQSHYRKRLAGLLHLTLRRAESVLEIKDLLCTWLEWTDRVPNNSHHYEARIQSLLTDILAADNSRETRGQLTACLQSCGGSGAATRILANL